MNVSTFLEHWNIRENPFLAEEARQDQVFSRLATRSEHPDFAKILGDPGHPSTAVVFGEKGTGKTAIRLQIEDAVRQHNADHPDQRTLVVPYDDLNPMLDRFVRRAGGRSSTEEVIGQLRLVDHIDGILCTAVPEFVDALLGEPSSRVEAGERPGDALRRLSGPQKEAWLELQLLYDRSDRAVERLLALRKGLRYRRPSWIKPLRLLTVVLWVAFAAALVVNSFQDDSGWPATLGLAALGVLTLGTSGRALWDAFRIFNTARHLRRQLRVTERSAETFRACLEKLPAGTIAGWNLPTDELDDRRYRLLDQFKQGIQPFGYRSVMVLVDRIDEPTLVNGKVPLMRALVWPLFNNKFLQQDGFALKLMLPVELRHELHRQSSEFFQEARMDKQNLIDRLTWSGTTLYDLCARRLNACLGDGLDTLPLAELFEEGVNRQDVVDALDQMRQPRDAFKLMYQLIQQHCSTTTDEEERWHIPRLILDQVRRGQVDRLEALQRGLGPA